MFLISEAVAATIDISIPCISCKYAASSSPVGLIANFYELAIAFSGVLALGMIIYAGILRVTNASNPGKVGQSNEIIYNALLGIVLLFGSYILLNTINPQLAKLEIPSLAEIKIPPPTGGAGSTAICSGDTMGSCSLPVQKCEKGADGKFKCVPKDNVVWACVAKYYPDPESGIADPDKYIMCMRRTLPSGATRPKSDCDSNCLGLKRGDPFVINKDEVCIQSTADVCSIQ